MAAEQAAKLSEEKKLHVIPSRSVPEGISAMFCYEHDADPDEMEAAMKDAISRWYRNRNLCGQRYLHR